ncbi:MAG: UDP-N-acetylmuramoyl-tripeptide--D-alanyl-D-alanine ligase [Lentisphaerae bacterium]|nr:UDP-N-acetylmuramoyl-tripeptide--D-alanyl-D-alanine ligase [Lentisphaerota bacterium]
MARFTAEELARWTGGVWRGRPPEGFEGVSHDTRTLHPDALYVALKGERYDGHAFVEEAFRQVAGGAVVEREEAGGGMGPLLLVPDTRVALKAMARGYRRKVAPRIVAVTGSAGKTTVKELLADMLARRVAAARTRGNWNNAVGVSLSVLEMEPDAEAGVFEIGTNHPGEIEELCRVLEPDWGVVTNIGPSHLEFFGTEAAVAGEKGALPACLPEDGTAVLNADGGFVDILRSRAGCRVVTAALGAAGADYTGETEPAGGLAVREPGARAPVRVGAIPPGPHMAANVLLAAATAREYGIDWDAVREALGAYRGAPLRWEICEAGGVRVINDAYNANPASMRAAVEAFAREPVRGRRRLVLGGMLELGRQEAEAHVALGGAIAAHGAWAGLIVVGPLGGLIADGAEQAGMPRAAVDRCADNADAAARLAERAAPGDAVLVKGSRGMRLEEVVEQFVRLRSGNHESR